MKTETVTIMIVDLVESTVLVESASRQQLVEILEDVSVPIRQVVGEVTISGAWQEVVLPIPTISGTAIIRLETATFVPGYADQRQLGFMLDWVELAMPSR